MLKSNLWSADFVFFDNLLSSPRCLEIGILLNTRKLESNISILWLLCRRPPPLPNRPTFRFKTSVWFWCCRFYTVFWCKIKFSLFVSYFRMELFCMAVQCHLQLKLVLFGSFRLPPVLSYVTYGSFKVTSG